jgi:hypothetical protein
VNYGLIVSIISIALVATYIFIADVSYWLKILVATILLLSFVWYYGLFLRAALGIALSLYFTYLKSR